MTVQPPMRMAGLRLPFPIASGSPVFSMRRTTKKVPPMAAPASSTTVPVVIRFAFSAVTARRGIRQPTWVASAVSIAVGSGSSEAQAA
jgi:hypothetical protein